MTVEQFTEATRAALAERLVSLVLYGSVARGVHVPHRSDVNTLLICDTVDEALFTRLEPPVRAWSRAGHPAPLIFTDQEWRESADAFPIEYEDIRQHHRVLAGRDPWPGIRVDPRQLRRQLEQELKGKLARLRQAYATVWGDRKRMAQVVASSGGGFFTMLRATLRLAGKSPSAAADALVQEASAVVGFAAAPLTPLVAHATGGRPLKLGAADPLPTAYLDAVARTAAFVHRLA